MPTEEIVKYFAGKEKLERLRLQLVLQCAPVLKGRKAAGMVILSGDEAESLRMTLKYTKVLTKTLYQDARKDILLLYRREDLNSCLKAKQAEEYLQIYGYSGKSLNEMLSLLAERAGSYYKGIAAYPHEIGIFLGYPAEDVIGFMENEGKNFLLTGYWKVYENAARAEDIFQEYDRVKEIAVKEVLEGKTIYEITA